ncbi:MAG: insulinase family protein [Cyclobacteriaceae bacterium]|nr:insulinase family protein [Cyclobacteriaceae bacterium]
MLKVSTLSFFLFVVLGCTTTPPAEEQREFTIDYQKFTLDNGLEVILHEDHSDPIVAVATIMHVGSNREKPGKTGFAHFFEHMSFNDSENAPRGANRKLIPEWGGSRNGGTWSDGTIYYEVVPKDAFDKILWIDSDRFGYMINTVTEAALEREKQVVKNEKRQRVDNAPYGYTNEIIRKNLYPEGHPYSWTVIGSLPDLQAATLEDVKEFYHQYYGASNASLVIAGDIDVQETKQKVERWFGEISKGPEVPPLGPMPVTLDVTKKLYYEDNFAKLPELRMVFPTVEEYHQDGYALEILGQLLAGSRKSPLYRIIVEDKQFAPAVRSFQNSNELAGEFTFRIRANAGTNLDSVYQAVEQALLDFETNGFDDSELLRIKAELETNLYQGVATILNKAFQLVVDNEFAQDPGFITKRAQMTNAVTREDVMRVYQKYLKQKNFVMTSVIPKGQAELAVSGSQEAEVWIEEVVANVADEEVSQGEEAEYEVTFSKYDRSEPNFGELPLFKMPEIWTHTLDNQMSIYGIENNELPLVTFDLTFKGGHWLDPLEKSGVADLTADLLTEGTANKTPAELEEAVGLLGAEITVSSGSETFTISATCLSKNFATTVALVKEIITQPRWDATEFERLHQALRTELKGREANPTAIAYWNFYGLLYGEEHILGTPSNGNLETIADITLDDLKAYFRGLSSAQATWHIAGDVSKQQAVQAFGTLEDWQGGSVDYPFYQLPADSHAGKLFFIDVPGSKQSVIYIGKLALSGTSDQLNNLDFANEILGGGSSGKLFQTLRIEKGYTYGAYSYINPTTEIAPFVATSSVRANATLPSLQIMRDMIRDYGISYGPEEVEITQKKVLKANTRSYESLNAKLGILRQISRFGRDLDYLEQDQEELLNMTLQDYQSIIDQYLQEDEMIYLVVGDKATQFSEVQKLGKPVVELDIFGKEIP